MVAPPGVGGGVASWTLYINSVIPPTHIAAINLFAGHSNAHEGSLYQNLAWSGRFG